MPRFATLEAQILDVLKLRDQLNRLQLDPHHHKLRHSGATQVPLIQDVLSQQLGQLSPQRPHFNVIPELLTQGVLPFVHQVQLIGAVHSQLHLGPHHHRQHHSVVTQDPPIPGVHHQLLDQLSHQQHK